MTNEQMNELSAHREDIWRSIREQIYANELRHGGPKHDDTHSRRDWVALIVGRLGKADCHADEMATGGFIAAMVEVCALAVDAITSTERIALAPRSDGFYSTAEYSTIEAEVNRSHEIINGQTEEIATLREALAPFANRAAEKAAAGKCSPLTESQWNRALEVYQK